MKVVITIVAAITTIAVWACLLGILFARSFPFMVGDGFWSHESVNTFIFLLCAVGSAGALVGFCVMMIKVWNKD